MFSDNFRRGENKEKSKAASKSVLEKKTGNFNKMKNKKLKNLDSLILVAIILIVIGCKCNGDLFKALKGDTESNSASNTSAPSNTGSNLANNSDGNKSEDKFPRSSNTNSLDGDSNPTGKAMDRFPLSVGTFSRVKADSADPKKEGFGNALELVTGEYSGGNQKISFAVAKYDNAAEAQKMLKDQLADLKKQNAKVSEVGTATNNSGQEIGISAEAEGKGNLVVLWTNKTFLQVAYGPKKATEDFFTAYDVP